MTLAKCQTCLAAITTAGYDAVANQRTDGSWTITAKLRSGSAGSIDLSQAAALATAQAITGAITEVVFS